MLTAVIFLIVLAVLIFVHELGHFLFAKMFGIRVDAFKIGFGPKIVAWTPKSKDGVKGETEYGLNLIPFGGYVKIFGENPDDMGNATSASSPAFVKAEQSRSIAHKPRWKQAVVLVGGVLFNIIFAWIIYSSLFTYGVTATADGFTAYGKYFSNNRIMITDVLKGSPAEIAGLKTGDVIKAKNIESVQNSINDSKGNEMGLSIIRGNTESNINIIPKAGIVNDKYAIGIAMNDVVDMQLPFYIAVYEGGHYTLNMLKETAVGLFIFVSQAIHGNADINQITGPVGIAGVVGDAARLGFTYLLMITALISINLAVINLVPFPALDGGRVLFVFIESIIRRKLPSSFSNWTNLIGFSLLMILMVIITYRDIAKLFK